MKRLAALLAASVLTVPALLAREVRTLELRAFLHDPVRPATVLQVKDQSGALVPLGLRTEGMSLPCDARLADDELVVHREGGEVAARAKVPAGFKRAMAVIVPAATADAVPPYRMIVLDDSPAAFPWGSSRIVSLLGVETAVQSGEHKLPLPGGKVTTLPEVKKVDEFNMAQTNFYFREGANWVPFTERRLQFVGDIRRVFIVHATPGSQRPFVAAVVDYKPHEGT